MLNAFVAATTLIATLFTASVSLSAEFKELTGDPPPLEADVSDDIRSFHERALDGDPGAQNDLGRAYLLGEGVPKDLARAIYWLRRASTPAFKSRASFFLNCALIETRDAKLMAEGGAAFAAELEKSKTGGTHIIVSKLYRFGIGVPQDHQRADVLVAEAGDILRERENFSGADGWSLVAKVLAFELASGVCVGPDLPTAARIREAAAALAGEPVSPQSSVGSYILPYPRHDTRR